MHMSRSWSEELFVVSVVPPSLWIQGFLYISEFCLSWPLIFSSSCSFAQFFCIILLTWKFTYCLTNCLLILNFTHQWKKAWRVQARMMQALVGGPGDRNRGNGHKLKQRRCRLSTGTLVCCACGQALAGIAHGGWRLSPYRLSKTSWAEFWEAGCRWSGFFSKGNQWGFSSLEIKTTINQRIP